MTTHTATVTRHSAPSGNRDADYFQPTCAACGWCGALHSNRTVEGRRLAQRDADGHRCPDFYDTLHDSIPSDVPDTVWESDGLSKGAGA